MQLLRDNLTLWTSSDGGDGEPSAEAPKDAEKTTDDTKPETSDEQPPAPQAAS